MANDKNFKVKNGLDVGGSVTLTGSSALIFDTNQQGLGGELGLRGSGEGFQIFEPEESNKVWLQIDDDPAGSNTAFKINSTSGMVPVFHDQYHPNADKWTTARTITLTGDVTGSTSIDGSANVSITTVVGNDSHTHTFITGGDTGDLNASFTQRTPDRGLYPDRYNSTAANKPVSYDNANSVLNWYSHGSGGTGSYGKQIATANNGALYFRNVSNGSFGTWNRIFADDYHPNADKWTTARTNTVALTGDVTGTGSASVDGSGNWTVSVATTVANDSHTHSTYLPLTGGTMSGNITFSDDQEGIVWSRNTDAASIKFYNTADGDTNSRLEFNIADNTNEDFRFTYTTGGTTTELLRMMPDGGQNGITFRGNTVWHAGNLTPSDYLLTANYVDDYVSSASFNTGTGVLTLTRAEGGTVTVDLDGRYLQSETDSQTLSWNGGTGELSISNGNTVDLDGRYVEVAGDTMTGALTIQLDAESSRAPTALTLHSTMADINGAGDTDGTFIEFKATDQNATFTPQVKIGMLVKDYTGDGGIPSEGTGNFVVYTAQGTDSGGSGTLTERFRVREDGPLYAGSDRVFADNYHPNADKWTTARTLSLTGDVTGSTSIDGSANVSITTTVANDSHSHSNYLIKTGDTATGTITFNGQVNLNQWVYMNVAGQNFVLNSDTTNRNTLEWQQNSTRVWTLDLQADGDLNFVPSSGDVVRISDNRIFDDGYHPNADKWTTARTNTVTLTGDVTGTGSASVDGSGNWTVSVNSTVANDSHSHSNYVLKTGDTLTGTLNYRLLSDQQTSNYDTAGDSSGFSVFYGTSSATSKPSGTDHAVTTLSYSNAWQVQEAADWRTNARYIRKQENGTWSSWQRLFADDYHPNADKWTTARTNTVTLTGDVTGTGSASVDGSGNWTVSVAADWRGGTANTTVDMNNFNIENVNNLTFNDPGPGEGLEWKTGNGWKIYESPNDLTTNTAGNLQFVTGSTRNVTMGTDGSLYVRGLLTATQKSFTIDHPTKEGHKLRYGSLEGPENGVYVRGRLKDSNVIELPEYWTKLVDLDSITVQLTAIGGKQDIWVEDISDNKVYVGGAKDCFYMVNAERVDVEKLEVEFEA